MYKQGKYKYKSQKAYENKLIAISSLFFFVMLFLLLLKDGMNIFLFNFTFYLSMIMIVHLFLRFISSKGIIKSYVFNEW
ncbi:MAG: hypothetical protein PF569_02700 [Candidatus Woesearchaeota archaeon]|jgi:ABC-type multidrug transport system permease subunit|nr:hypothetical protein [Candidatus Woesearchaeota archaeon]